MDSTIPLYPLSEPRARNFLTSKTRAPSGCYNPRQIRRAYGINDTLSASNITIALIEAYYHPNVQSDLDTFSDKFSLPRTNVVIKGDLSAYSDESWAIETATDVQWAHAIAPDAKLQVYCAASTEYPDLFEAVSSASADGADIISMSFGSDEFSSQQNYEQVFINSSSIFLCAAGDIGGKVVFPSSSGYVVSVGGTSLALSPNGLRLDEETAWKNSGGGPSAYNKIPYYQSVFENIPQLSGGMRATPDISFFADPSPGFCVYYTESDGNGKWLSVGGTSVATPCVAGIVALSMAQQDTKNKSYPEFLYTLAGTVRYNRNQDSFYDITKGNNTVFEALPGYDLCTGLGTPKRVFGK